MSGALPGYGELPPELADPATAAVAIVPVPYDGTSTWHKGAAAGPRAILEASQALELYDLETDSEPHRHGIATLAAVSGATSPEAVANEVAATVGALLAAGKLPVVIGGEHSVSIGAVRAAARRFPDLTVLQLDAHADTRESYQGSDHNHACVMARVRELCPIVQVGLRSLDGSELERLDRSRVVWAHDIAADRDETWIDRVVALLGDPIYITIDLDVLDPAVLPATGTPEPGGLSWYQVTGLLERVTAGRRVVGFDVVELCPAPGHHASAFLAAKLIYRLLAMVLGPYQPST